MEKIVLIIKHADDEPEFFLNPMMMALNAISAGLHPLVVLEAGAVNLARSGYFATAAPELRPAEGLIESFLQGGGRMLVLASSLKSRGIEGWELIDGVVVVGPASVMREVQEARHVIAY